MIQASRASILGKRLDIDLPLAGPARLACRIEGDTPALALKRISLSAGQASAVQVKAQGQLLFGDWARPDPLQSVDLTLHASSHDSGSLGDLVGKKLPELGALSLGARLHTVSGRQRVDDVLLQTRPGAPVKVSLTGAVEAVSLLPRLAVQGVRLRGEAFAADSAQLNAVFDLPGRIPALGPFMAQARIYRTRASSWALNLRAYASERPTLRLSMPRVSSKTCSVLQKRAGM